MAERPYVLSIAGVDPSSGAGLLADIKTFEQLKVYGLGVPSSVTIQTENAFFANQWQSKDYMFEGIKRMLNTYPVSAVKIGIIEDLEILAEITGWIKQNNLKTRVIWDPVIKSTTDFRFNKKWQLTPHVFSNIDVLTPNSEEWDFLKVVPLEEINASIVIKGGHSEKKGFDKLWLEGEWLEIPPQTTLQVFEKHGSGCVYSSALTAFLSLGHNLQESCKKAKEYTEIFLAGTKEKLGYHNGEIALHISR